MGDIVHFAKPDSEVVRKFADQISGFEDDNRLVRGVVLVCLVDDEIVARAYSNERLTSILGSLVLAGQIIQEDYMSSIDA